MAPANGVYYTQFLDVKVTERRTLRERIRFMGLRTIWGSRAVERIRRVRNLTPRSTLGTALLCWVVAVDLRVLVQDMGRVWLPRCDGAGGPLVVDL
mgnify:CR=1 FL=1